MEITFFWFPFSESDEVALVNCVRNLYTVRTSTMQVISPPICQEISFIAKISLTLSLTSASGETDTPSTRYRSSPSAWMKAETREEKGEGEINNGRKRLKDTASLKSISISLKGDRTRSGFKTIRRLGPNVISWASDRPLPQSVGPCVLENQVLSFPSSQSNHLLMS